MKRALLLFAAVMAFAGCRAPTPQFDPFAPYGPQRIPPPATFSVGAPMPQPVPYYPGATTYPGTGMPPQGQPDPSIAPAGMSTQQGWRPQDNNVNLSADQVARLNTTTLPGANNGSLMAPPTGPTSFSAPAVTNPAAIHSGAPAATVPQSGTNGWINPNDRTAAATPWQTPNPVNSNGAANAQLWQANSAPPGQPTSPSSLGNALGIQFSGTQPSASGATGTSSTLPLRGMPVNDATSGYAPGTAYPPSVPSGYPQTVPAQGYPQPQMTQPPQLYPQSGSMPQTWAPQSTPANWPTGGYSSAAPTSMLLPLRGTEAATNAAATANASPAAAWGHTTIRGNNDDAEVEEKAETHSAKSSPIAHIADRFGHHASYAWLRGRVEYSQTQKRWKLRYIPHDSAESSIDVYGGSVELVGQSVAELKSGQYVQVNGKLMTKKPASGSGDFAPQYQVESVSVIE